MACGLDWIDISINYSVLCTQYTQHVLQRETTDKPVEPTQAWKRLISYDSIEWEWRRTNRQTDRQTDLGNYKERRKEG